MLSTDSYQRRRRIAMGIIVLTVILSSVLFIIPVKAITLTDLMFAATNYPSKGPSLIDGAVSAAIMDAIWENADGSKLDVSARESSGLLDFKYWTNLAAVKIAQSGVAMGDGALPLAVYSAPLLISAMINKNNIIDYNSSIFGVNTTESWADAIAQSVCSSTVPGVSDNKHVSDYINGNCKSIISNAVSSAISRYKTNLETLKTHIEQDVADKNYLFSEEDMQKVNNDPYYSSNGGTATPQSEVGKRLKDVYLFKILGIKDLSANSVKKIQYFVLALLIGYALLKTLAQVASGANAGMALQIFISEVFQLVSIYFIGGWFLYEILSFTISTGFVETIAKLLDSYVRAINVVMYSTGVYASTSLVLSLVTFLVILFIKLGIVFGLANLTINIVFAVIVINVIVAIAYFIYPLIFLKDIKGISVVATIAEGLITRAIEVMLKISIISVVLVIFGESISVIIRALSSAGGAAEWYVKIGISIFTLMLVQAYISLISKLFSQVWQDSLKILG